VFAGTSLHGAITALSYTVPHFAISSSDRKVHAFLDTWDIDAQRVIRRFDELTAGTAAALRIPKPDLLTHRDRLVAQTSQGLAAMAAALQLPAPRFPRLHHNRADQPAPDHASELLPSP